MVPPVFDAIGNLPEGRGFSPDEITATSFCTSRISRSPDESWLREMRDGGIIRLPL
jgi:hypothetical protein